MDRVRNPPRCPSRITFTLGLLIQRERRRVIEIRPGSDAKLLSPKFPIFQPWIVN